MARGHQAYQPKPNSECRHSKRGSRTTWAALVALGHETRLDIFRLLVQAGPKGLPAGQIGERLGLPPATLSFHLNQLKHANLVTFRRESRSLIYSAAYPVMNALLAYMTENCCQGDAGECCSSTC